MLGVILLLTACALQEQPPEPTPVARSTAPVPSPLAPAVATRAPLPALQRHGPLPVISQVQVVSGAIGRYDRFEVHAALTTAAHHLDLPFDPAPPPGLMPGDGVSVDALFSPDGWTTVISQPAFLEQPYTATVRDGRDHLTPAGPAHWTVRFTPQQAGMWQYRLRAIDAGGVTLYPPSGALTFQVAAQSTSLYQRRGFLGVSPTDRRYFAWSDGTPFVGVGFNDAFGAADATEQKLQRYEQHQINFLRVWMSSAGINGSAWSSWASHHLAADGYLPGVAFDTANNYQGGDVSLRLDSANPCLFSDFYQGGIAVEPGSIYEISARVKLDHVSGPVTAGASGFVIKRGQW